ncbi:hypothetical protein SAMN05877838_3776 [Hoeflea halophila]|uniref:AlpA family transcriptional regulator n=1 Tax=Hoeflea halophila TaxID=714899 RepID=A0A286IFI1_9HYPH|nr:hypothetical protein [Hoeflea halophila]SOE18832.1 hypothetical protein SAMN05877838_3776 [Hoeflea halophila]
MEGNILISRAEASRRLGVAEITYRKREGDGTLPPTMKVGTKVMVRARDVQHYINTLGAETVAPVGPPMKEAA